MMSMKFVLSNKKGYKDRYKNRKEEKQSDYYQLINKYIKNSYNINQRKMTSKILNTKKKKDFPTSYSKRNSSKLNEMSKSYEEYQSRIKKNLQTTFNHSNKTKNRMKKRVSSNSLIVKMKKPGFSKQMIKSQKRKALAKIKDKDKFLQIVVKKLHDYPKLNFELKRGGAI